MNYDGPRQKDLGNGTGGRWDYTRRNDHRIWPKGYCAGWRDLSPEVYGLGEDSVAFKRDQERMEKFRAKYHNDGHATKEEACACYREYLLDQELRLDKQMSGQKRICQVEGCNEWTQGMAEVGHEPFILCDQHRTREEVEKLFGDVGETFSSW